MAYAGEPLLWDGGLRQSVLGELVQLGAAVEAAFGGVPQVGRCAGCAVLRSARCLPVACAPRRGGRPILSWEVHAGPCALAALPTPAAACPACPAQDIEGVRTADGSTFVVQSRAQVLHQH